MHSSFLHTAKIILAATALVLFVGAVASLGGISTDTARASAGDNVSGFAWSDNIGWISFNSCTDPDDSATCAPGSAYGVDVDETEGETGGKMSGYAWGSAIGWIRFDPPEDGGYPGASAPHGAQIEDWTNTAVTQKLVTGWARACAVFSSGCSGSLKSDTTLGGWDGWIKMSDSSWDPDGVTFDSGSKTFSGYAWGSDIVGWISFNCNDDGSCGTSNYAVALGASPPVPATPSVTLTPASQSVESGRDASITWRIQNLKDAFCTITDALGSAVAWTSIPNPIPTTDAVGTETISAVTAAQTYTLNCPGATPVSASVDVNPFIKSFSADPQTIFNDGSVPSLLSYIITNGQNSDVCAIDNDVGVLAFSCSGTSCAGSYAVTPVFSTDYTLSCSRAGSAYLSGTRSARVNVFTPDFILDANPNKIDMVVIGENGGGKSNKAIIKVIKHASFTKSPITFTVTSDPFYSDPDMPAGTTYSYHFRPVPHAGEDPPPPEDNELKIGRYLDGIEFWVESVGPLPARSQSVIEITGTKDAISRTALIYLDTRAFNPEYREF